MMGPLDAISQLFLPPLSCKRALHDIESRFRVFNASKLIMVTNLRKLIFNEMAQV